jgi:hypothetical protein
MPVLRRSAPQVSGRASGVCITFTSLTFILATLNLNMPGKPSFTPLNLPFQRNLKNSRMP